MIDKVIQKPNIIIVDDHMIFRQGITSLLTSEEICTVIAEASNGADFITLLKHHKPDLVLMDIDMPHMNGMEATQIAMEMIPDLKIIIFTMFSDEEYYYKMIELGVKGFIMKSSGINELEIAIHTVMRGESYFSNELLRKIINNFGRKNISNVSEKKTFTERELEVLQEICNGLNNEEISQKLFISPQTVKTHKSNLLDKTGCKNIPGLILFVLKNKIIELSSI